MIIGNFKHDQAKDTYAGEIKTLTLLRGRRFTSARWNPSRTRDRTTA